MFCLQALLASALHCPDRPPPPPRRVLVVGSLLRAAPQGGRVWVNYLEPPPEEPDEDDEEIIDQMQPPPKVWDPPSHPPMVMPADSALRSQTELCASASHRGGCAEWIPQEGRSRGRTSPSDIARRRVGRETGWSQSMTSAPSPNGWIEKKPTQGAALSACRTRTHQKRRSTPANARLVPQGPRRHGRNSTCDYASSSTPPTKACRPLPDPRASLE